jgi:hypothetical protein
MLLKVFSDNYVSLVNEMLYHFQKLGCTRNMSIKVIILEQSGDLNEEQGELFHQEIKTMEERYQGKWDTYIMADYCWGLMRD